MAMLLLVEMSVVHVCNPPQAMLGEMSKARLRIPQPVRLQNITELTRMAKERVQDSGDHQNVTETLSIHVDFSADSSPDPELGTLV